MLNPTLQKYVAAIALANFLNLNLHAAAMANPSRAPATDERDIASETYVVKCTVPSDLDDQIAEQTSKLHRGAARLAKLTEEKVDERSLKALKRLDKLVNINEASPYDFERAVGPLVKRAGLAEKAGRLIEKLREDLEDDSEMAAKFFWQDLRIKSQQLLTGELDANALMQNLSYYWANGFVKNTTRYYGLKALKHLVQHERSLGRLRHFSVDEYQKLTAKLRSGMARSKKNGKINVDLDSDALDQFLGGLTKEKGKSKKKGRGKRTESSIRPVDVAKALFGFFKAASTGNSVVKGQSTVMRGVMLTASMAAAAAALSATNTNQGFTYTEDVPYSFGNSPIVISGAFNGTVSAKLTLSGAIGPGDLASNASNSVNPTFNAGVWRASGNESDVNAHLATLGFDPDQDVDWDFNIFVELDDPSGGRVADVMPGIAIPVNDKPVLDRNNLEIDEGAVVTPTPTHLRATDIDNTDAELVWNVEGMQNLELYRVNDPSNVGNVRFNFTQAEIDNGDMRFRSPGGMPSANLTVCDQQPLCTAPQALGFIFTPLVTALTAGPPPELVDSSSSADGQIAGVAPFEFFGGVIALTVTCASAGAFAWKTWQGHKGKHTRENYPVAAAARKELKLDIYDFNSDDGRTLIDSVETSLLRNLGLEGQTLTFAQQAALGNLVAGAIRSRHSEFGYQERGMVHPLNLVKHGRSSIDVDKLSGKIQQISDYITGCTGATTVVAGSPEDIVRQLLAGAETRLSTAGPVAGVGDSAVGHTGDVVLTVDAVGDDNGNGQ